MPVFLGTVWGINHKEKRNFHMAYKRNGYPKAPASKMNIRASFHHPPLSVDLSAMNQEQTKLYTSQQ